jgi:hypothetical protein
VGRIPHSIRFGRCLRPLALAGRSSELAWNTPSTFAFKHAKGCTWKGRFCYGGALMRRPAWCRRRPTCTDVNGLRGHLMLYAPAALVVATAVITGHEHDAHLPRRCPTRGRCPLRPQAPLQRIVSTHFFGTTQSSTQSLRRVLQIWLRSRGLPVHRRGALSLVNLGAVFIAVFGFVSPKLHQYGLYSYDSASSSARIANLRRDNARRSYRSIARNFSSLTRIVTILWEAPTEGDSLPAR